jgi:hypothetical protein
LGRAEPANAGAASITMIEARPARMSILNGLAGRLRTKGLL